MPASRFQFLDGIRGLAAILVLLRHTGSYWHFGFFRSYLAVDIFFILSGFVIAQAYDRKLESGQVGFFEFVCIRLIRLYPVYILSVLIAAVALLWLGGEGHNLQGNDSASLWTTLALTAIFLPSLMTGSNKLFSLNEPYWSLFFELIANFIYAAIRPALKTGVLVVVVVISGLVLGGVSIQHGNLNLGYTWDPLSLLGGFSRSIFGIFMGLLLHRSSWAMTQSAFTRVMPWIAMLVICAVLSSPSLHSLDGAVDVVVVWTIFPALVLVASRAAPSKLDGVLILLGAVSYPLYVLHKPVGELLSFAVGPAVVGENAPVSGVLLLVLLVLGSILVERKYDIPIRKALTKLILR